jgi:hypothetical protein
MPEMRMNSLQSFAMNCGPLSEIIRGFAPGYISFARSKLISMSASVIERRASLRAARGKDEVDYFRAPDTSPSCDSVGRLFQ